jgi:hypothetical protein
VPQGVVVLGIVAFALAGFVAAGRIERLAAARRVETFT